jgi:hypothetical protein
MHDFPPFAVAEGGGGHRCDHGLRKVNAKPGLESSCRSWIFTRTDLRLAHRESVAAPANLKSA